MAAPAQLKASALRVWWSFGAPGRGTRALGVPIAASSATVEAPALQTAKSQAAKRAGICRS